MSDPLKLLRDYASGDTQLRRIDQGGESYIAFGENAFPNDTPTNLGVYGKQGQFYSIESILFLWENRQLPHPAYVKDAAGRNINPVTRPDRKAIIDYLSGQLTEFPSFYDASQPYTHPINVKRLQADFSVEPDRKKPKLDPGVNSQRIDQLLNKEEGGDGGELRSLNEDLTIEKIAALKKKRINHQKKNIASTAVDDGMEVTESTARIDRDVRARERIWRTRANCMEAATKNFTGVLELLKSLKVREEAARKAAHAPPSNHTNENKHSMQRPKQQAGYSRYDQELFNKEHNSDFQIDVEMSFVGTNILGGGLKGNANPTVKKEPSTPRPAPQRSVSSHPTPSSDSGTPRKRTSKTPIIIIPAAGTSLITMYNARELLQDMRYVSSDENKRLGKRETEVLLQRKRGDVTVPYRVIDNPLKLTEEEWDRVVAVFVMGPAWQFKSWKWKGNPVEIFTHIAAFHLHFDEAKLDPNITKWSLTKIPISRDKRHLDKARLVKFWDVLDKFLAKHKSHLRY